LAQTRQPGPAAEPAWVWPGPVLGVEQVEAAGPALAWPGLELKLKPVETAEPG
jgi:hypothetical protein